MSALLLGTEVNALFILKLKANLCDIKFKKNKQFLPKKTVYRTFMKILRSFPVRILDSDSEHFSGVASVSRRTLLISFNFQNKLDKIFGKTGLPTLTKNFMFA